MSDPLTANDREKIEALGIQLKNIVDTVIEVREDTYPYRIMGWSPTSIIRLVQDREINRPINAASRVNDTLLEVTKLQLECVLLSETHVHLKQDLDILYHKCLLPAAFLNLRQAELERTAVYNQARLAVLVLILSLVFSAISILVTIISVVLYK